MWGPDFKRNVVIHAPVANFDIAPTVLALEGMRAPNSMSGRVIAEAILKPQREDPKFQVQQVQTRSGSYCATIQLSTIGKRTYVDQGQRCR
jgi:arylsulfatase A-like enzyme